MPDFHWLSLTFERLDKLLFDSVARKWMSDETIAALSAERDRLFALIKIEIDAGRN